MAKRGSKRKPIPKQVQSSKRLLAVKSGDSTSKGQNTGVDADRVGKFWPRVRKRVSTFSTIVATVCGIGGWTLRDFVSRDVPTAVRVFTPLGLAGEKVIGSCYSKSLYSARSDAVACLTDDLWHDPCFKVRTNSDLYACPRSNKPGRKAKKEGSYPFRVELVDVSKDRSQFPEVYLNPKPTDGETRAFGKDGSELPWFLRLSNGMYCMRSPTERVTAGQQTQYRCDRTQDLLEPVIKDDPSSGKENTYLLYPNGSDQGPFDSIGLDISRSTEYWYLYRQVPGAEILQKTKITAAWS
jgi:hypothetical protein